MGEFLGALVAIPSSRRLRIVGPYENMAWLITAADNSSNSFLRPVFAETGELPGTKTTPRGTETVLLVEDEDQVRAILKQILENQGYHVLSASHGEEALAISQEPGDIQLMITDVVMPQMSGRELAERVIAARPSLRVPFMSGYTDDAIVRHGLLDEKLNFIQKPFDSATVSRKVREVLDSHV